MAHLIIKDPDVDKLRDIALLCHRLRHFTKGFRKELGIHNRQKMEVYEKKIDEWLSRNVVIVGENFTEDET